MHLVTKKINQLNIYLKRIEILIGARFRDQEAISSAAEAQDRLRKKIGKWHGGEEIKKWRMMH